VLGTDSFTPFLTEYIRAHDPPFDGYHMALMINHTESGAFHEIALASALAPVFTAVGVGWRKVYVVRLRLFANLCAPDCVVVVGKPAMPLQPRAEINMAR
jgi:hypothetical protein